MQLLASFAMGATFTLFSDPVAIPRGGIVLHPKVPISFPAVPMAITGIASDFIDEHNLSVSLSDTYVHHWFFVAERAGGRTLSVGAGSEFRGAPEVLPFPWIMQAHGDEDWWAQLHFIDLAASKDNATRFLPCLECRRRRTCGAYPNASINDGPCVVDSARSYIGDDYPGGIYACGGDLNTGSDFCRRIPNAPVAKYRLRVDVTYTPLPTVAEQQSAAARAVTDSSLHAEAPYSEYQVPTCKATDMQCAHVKVSEWLVEGGFAKCTSCPVFNHSIAPGKSELSSFALPSRPALVWAMGHQHIGGLGIQLWATAPGEKERLICNSAPRYGTEDGVAGNEKGFLVGQSSCAWTDPLAISEGTKLTVRSTYEAHAPAYDTSEYLASGAQIAHTGVMGYMRLRWVSMPEARMPQVVA